MNREMILGQIQPDVACAIALGILEDSRVIVNLEAITVHDTQMRPLGTVRNWLSDTDALDLATREYLQSRRQAAMTDPGVGRLPLLPTLCPRGGRAHVCQDLRRAISKDDKVQTLKSKCSPIAAAQ